MSYIYTEKGKEEARRYIEKMYELRKEIVDNNAYEEEEDLLTTPPTTEAILTDVNSEDGVKSDGWYATSWSIIRGVPMDFPLLLKVGVDLIKKPDKGGPKNEMH